MFVGCAVFFTNAGRRANRSLHSRAQPCVRFDMAVRSHHW